ncbi:hypothetical protein A2311_06145 [candidate division WOR-1 bacterium RIFOXYB2_FULL_48_7]|uniref:Uncharacterized protein n=1 Tax=candidate division WOR-1 bacterium RIFOXYB2_FULL_48_7 TaxID=1802583 RepID=A0A1F4TRQ3_UNCSA|nr:MAG: hypothetical protein A2311_06145 [candidate division WOR-1 bacterium RIFOXYB2_FULL_48_7]
MNKSAVELFRFYTSSLLVQISGKKAANLPEFLAQLRLVDESVIFYHIHHAFREYYFAPGQYSNDFARWIEDEFKESALAEKIASVELLEVTSLAALRDQLVKIMEQFLGERSEKQEAVPAGREFYFLANVGIIVPTQYEVRTIEEFVLALERVGMRSLYYHFFDARLRLGRKTNDFSNWIRHSLKNEQLAKEIELLDPYLMTMDQLKKRIIELCLGERKPPIMKTLAGRLYARFWKRGK